MSTETVIQGTILNAGVPVPGAYVRLLDEHAEFTAEVQTSATGAYRFFAAPGTWTLRVLAGGGVVSESTVTAGLGINDIDVTMTTA